MKAEVLLRELAFRLPASARVALLGEAAGLRARVDAAHPDVEHCPAEPGSNLDLIVAVGLAEEDLPRWKRALRPGGSLLLWLDSGDPAQVTETLEAADYEVKRAGPASRTGLGLRARLGLGRGAMIVRALRHPGTAQH